MIVAGLKRAALRAWLTIATMVAGLCLLYATAHGVLTVTGKDPAPEDEIQLRVTGSGANETPPDGFFTVGTGANPWVIESSAGRDILTSGRTGVEFFGGPCVERVERTFFCFQGRWTYTQPDGEKVIIGHVDSAGVLSFTAGDP